MASENQVPVHSSGKAQGSLVVFILGISLTDPHPIPSRGASVLHGAQNNKRGIKAFPAAAAWAKQGAGIPNFHPNVLLDTWCRHAGLGKGLWERGSTFGRPMEKRGTLHRPPSLKGEGPLEKKELPRAGCPGRGGQPAAPRDAPVPLRAWCIPPMPLYSSSTRSAAMPGPPARPAPPRAPPARSAALWFPPPAPLCAAPERRRPGLGARPGNRGRDGPHRTRPPRV